MFCTLLFVVFVVFFVLDLVPIFLPLYHISNDHEVVPVYLCHFISSQTFVYSFTPILISYLTFSNTRKMFSESFCSTHFPRNIPLQLDR